MKTDGAARDDADGATWPWPYGIPKGETVSGKLVGRAIEGGPAGHLEGGEHPPRVSAPPRAPLEAAIWAAVNPA